MFTNYLKVSFLLLFCASLLHACEITPPCDAKKLEPLGQLKIAMESELSMQAGEPLRVEMTRYFDSQSKVAVVARYYENPEPENLLLFATFLTPEHKLNTAFNNHKGFALLCALAPLKVLGICRRPYCDCLCITTNQPLSNAQYPSKTPETFNYYFDEEGNQTDCPHGQYDISGYPPSWRGNVVHLPEEPCGVPRRVPCGFSRKPLKEFLANLTYSKNN